MLLHTDFPPGFLTSNTDRPLALCSPVFSSADFFLCSAVSYAESSTFYSGYHRLVWLIFLKDFIYLFLDRGEGRETSMCGCLSCAPHRGPGLQPRHVPWRGIQPATFWFEAHAQSTEPHQPGLIVFFLKESFEVGPRGYREKKAFAFSSAWNFRILWLLLGRVESSPIFFLILGQAN